MFLPIPQLGELFINSNRITDLETVEFPVSLCGLRVSYNNIDKGLANLLALNNLTKVNVNQICAKSANPSCCTERKVIVKSLMERNVTMREDYFDDCPEDK